MRKFSQFKLDMHLRPFSLFNTNLQSCSTCSCTHSFPGGCWVDVRVKAMVMATLCTTVYCECAPMHKKPFHYLANSPHHVQLYQVAHCGPSPTGLIHMHVCVRACYSLLQKAFYSSITISSKSVLSTWGHYDNGGDAAPYLPGAANVFLFSQSFAKGKLSLCKTVSQCTSFFHFLRI